MINNNAPLLHMKGHLRVYHMVDFFAVFRICSQYDNSHA